MKNKAVILCVDDEVTILKTIKKQLKNTFKDMYDYEMAENADEAIEIIEELTNEDIPIVLIVSDWLMPGMKGDEFLIQIHKEFPDVIKIMLTGHADEAAIRRAIEQANLATCLYKPLNTEELIQAIQSGLNSHE